jgi:hypothetical protein
MNHLRFLLAFLVVLGSYGLSSGQDQQQPPQQSQPQQPQYGVMYQPLDHATAREWTGLIPGYQQPAGVEPQHGVMTEVRAIHAPQKNPSKQVVRKIPGLGQTGVKPMAGEKLVGKDAQSPEQPRSFQPKPGVMNQRPRSSPDQQPAPTQDLFGGRNNPGDLIYACGSKGLAVDFVTGNCVAPRGQQINPQNLYPPFTAPLPKPEPHDLIMLCGVQGRSADVVTGRCM